MSRAGEWSELQKLMLIEIRLGEGNPTWQQISRRVGKTANQCIQMFGEMKRRDPALKERAKIKGKMRRTYKVAKENLIPHLTSIVLPEEIIKTIDKPTGKPLFLIPPRRARWALKAEDKL